MKDESPKKQLISKIKSVSNILVTVSRNPSVDQLTSALGLSLALNKMGKRSVAVFSGKIPNSIHFLNPEKTFEDNADSLRDFIISLSKDKADRLKVKPEGDFVKVYITPYRTRITPDDLKFIDGDFNIELIIAIGVGERDELDASIASHGKIFHNAVTATLNLGQLHDALGMISWQDGHFGCYAEMCYGLVSSLSEGNRSLIDEPVATAFLTGVVSATDQFRNSVTSPAIMTLSAELMSKGANQQLITSELESNPRDTTDNYDPSNKSNDKPDNTNDGMSFDRSRDQAKSSSDSEQSFVYDLGKSQDKTDLVKQVDPDLSTTQIDVLGKQLRESQQELAEQQGTDALHAAQAHLLESNGTIDVEPTKVEAPEAPTIDDMPVAKLASLPAEQPQDAQQPQPVKSIQPIEPMQTPVTPLPQPVETNLVEPVPQPVINNLPFNQPNQVSPIPNLTTPASSMVQPEPSLTQSVPMSITPGFTDTTSMTMPPLPPVPPMPSMPTDVPQFNNMVMPPTEQNMVMPPVESISQPAIPEPQLQPQPMTTNDPSQFVIPS